MFKKLLLIAAVAASCTAQAADVHWSYDGEGGPQDWAKLSPEFGACSGKNQSPIDISGTIRADIQPIKFRYGAGGNEIFNNGHTVQVNFAEGSSITLDGTQYALKQFHFHAPSENLIKGKAWFTYWPPSRIGFPE